MQFQWNVKYGIHIDFYKIVHFHLYNHIVVWILPFQILWKWQEEVRLVCNYRNNVDHLFWKEELFWQFLIYLEKSQLWTIDSIKVSGDEINGLISFNNIVETLSWPELCFAFNLLIIFFTVSCSISSKLKEHKMFSFKYDSILLSWCFGIFFDKLGPMFAKKVLNWFAISCLSEIFFIVHSEIRWKFFFIVGLAKNFINGCPCLFHICNIPLKLVVIVTFFSLIYVSL